MANGLLKVDTRTRCAWCGDDAVYTAYHDTEWGFPVRDDVRLFETLSLEGFQSGLSWVTILRKRENFRRAFVGFDFAKVARFGARDVARLLGDAGIVRRRGWSFVGPTAAYALMQAMGLVNDHLSECDIRPLANHKREP